MMADSEIRNARIEHTFLGVEDHGIFTWVLDLDYGDSSAQGYVGPGMDEPVHDGVPQYANDTKGKFLGRRGTAFGHECIRRLLAKLHVNSWEALKDQNVRARIEGGRVVAVGHFLKDDWFDAKEVADEMGIH